MSASDGIFDVKLGELERQYGETLRLLREYQHAGREQVRAQLRTLWREYRETELGLMQSINGSRSPAVAELAAAQAEYEARICRIMQEKLPGYLGGEKAGTAEAQAEAASLYGEYAIDFAVQALRHALLAALSAIDLQLSCGETEENGAQEGKTIHE